MLPGAAATAVALAHGLGLGVDLDALLLREQAVDAIEQQHARLVRLAARRFDLVELRRHRRFVSGVEDHLLQNRLGLREPLARLGALLQRALPLLFDRGRLLIGYAELGSGFRVDPPLFGSLPARCRLGLVVLLMRLGARALLSRTAVVC